VADNDRNDGNAVDDRTLIHSLTAVAAAVPRHAGDGHPRPDRHPAPGRPADLGADDRHLRAVPRRIAEQVESLAVEPLERIMSEIPGVKHVYSASMRGQGIVTVRFKVGEETGPSLVKVHDKLASNWTRCRRACDGAAGQGPRASTTCRW
jgi:hypothetical protein